MLLINKYMQYTCHLSQIMLGLNKIALYANERNESFMTSLRNRIPAISALSLQLHRDVTKKYRIIIVHDDIIS